MGATTYRLMSGCPAEMPGPLLHLEATAFVGQHRAGRPVITGDTGRERIFDGYPDIALDLVESRTFDGRLQLLEYVPTVLDGPPGAGG